MIKDKITKVVVQGMEAGYSPRKRYKDGTIKIVDLHEISVKKKMPEAGLVGFELKLLAEATMGDGRKMRIERWNSAEAGIAYRMVITTKGMEHPINLMENDLTEMGSLFERAVRENENA